MKFLNKLVLLILRIGENRFLFIEPFQSRGVVVPEKQLGRRQDSRVHARRDPAAMTAKSNSLQRRLACGESTHKVVEERSLIPNQHQAQWELGFIGEQRVQSRQH